VRQARDISQVRARRRQARRRQRLARLDLGLGVLGAIILIVATPGLAVSALIALLVLAACALSFVLERRKASRVERASTVRRSPRSPAGGSDRARGSSRRDLRGPPR
jgi:hypothetical protein